MRVAFTREAREDLPEITEHISKDAPGRALMFVRELRLSARKIGDAPRAHPLDARYGRSGVRRRVHGNYLILYRIVAERVDILRVVHGVRDNLRMPDLQN